MHLRRSGRFPVAVGLAVLSSAFVVQSAGAREAQLGQTQTQTQTEREGTIVERIDAKLGEASIRQARENSREIRQLHAEARGFVDEAKNERDIIKLNCVNKRFSALNDLLTQMQDREVALDEAADAKDFDEIAHLVELIDMALHRAQGLVAEARGCVGRGPLFSGNLELLVDVSQTEVEGFAESQEILVEDPTINTRPAAASPAS